MSATDSGEKASLRSVLARVDSCGPCAGTGEYPPDDGDECSWCLGGGEVVTYQCRVCGSTFGEPDPALDCEEAHPPVLVSTNVSYCVTHRATDHEGRAYEGCRFRQLFYFEDPMDENSVLWSDERPCGACGGVGCDVCGSLAGGSDG